MCPTNWGSYPTLASNDYCLSCPRESDLRSLTLRNWLQNGTVCEIAWCLTNTTDRVSINSYKPIRHWFTTFVDSISDQTLFPIELGSCSVRSIVIILASIRTFNQIHDFFTCSDEVDNADVCRTYFDHNHITPLWNITILWVGIGSPELTLKVNYWNRAFLWNVRFGIDRPEITTGMFLILTDFPEIYSHSQALVFMSFHNLNSFWMLVLGSQIP